MTESILIICAIGYVVANYLWARSVSDKLEQLEKKIKRIDSYDVPYHHISQWAFNQDVATEIETLQGVIKSWQELNKSIKEHTTKVKKAKKK